jgi:hypothetical protein
LWDRCCEGFLAAHAMLVNLGNPMAAGAINLSVIIKPRTTSETTMCNMEGYGDAREFHIVEGISIVYAIW